MVICCTALLMAPAAARSAPTPRPPTEPDRTLTAGAAQPAIWLLADEDTRIWLFGTNHVLPYDFAWRSPDLDAIIADADALVLESSDQEAIALFSDMDDLAALMMLEEPVSIFDRVSREHHMPLRALLKYSNISAEDLHSMQTWMVIFTLISGAFENAYGDSEDANYVATGVEDQLTALFSEQAKPIGAVERPMEQVDLFRTLPEAEQRALLESLIGDRPPDFDDPGEDILLRAWVAGDVSVLDTQCDGADSFPPRLREILLVQRNANWIEWLVGRLEQPGDLLFAVGACHLAGTASIQVMLEDRGYTIQRIH